MKNNPRILAQGHTISNDSHKTRLNNNDVIIAGSGGGKTRGYVMPNILQCMGSMIVTDPKGRLVHELGPTLVQEGYEVQSIDLTDCRHSYGYNPLDYISYDPERDAYSEQDIMTVSACLVPTESSSDPFWEASARMVLESLIGYVMECLPAEEHDLDAVVRLFGEMGNQRFHALFRELNEIAPDSFPATRYKLYISTMGAEKMYASIQGILAEKLSPLIFEGAKALYHNPHRIDFAALSKRNVAVFLTARWYGMAIHPRTAAPERHALRH